MNNFLQLAILSLTLSTSMIAQADKIDRVLDVIADGRIDIDFMDGKVIIEGWDQQQVRIVGDVPINDHNFSFETRGSNTKIEHISERGFWNSLGNSGSYANIIIYAPHSSNFRVDGISTKYILKNIKGQVRANTMSGDISLEGGVGNIDVESVSGDVRVQGASGRLNLASVSGSIEAEGNAEQFEAQTVSGNIDARIGRSIRINLASISGDIDLSLALSKDARLDADTVSGDIDVNFDSNAINASFDIETGPGGEVRNLISNHKPKNEFSISDAINFNLGDGDSSVNLKTMSGTIKIEKN